MTYFNDFDAFDDLDDFYDFDDWWLTTNDFLMTLTSDNFDKLLLLVQRYLRARLTKRYNDVRTLPSVLQSCLFKEDLEMPNDIKIIPKEAFKLWIDRLLHLSAAMLVPYQHHLKKLVRAVYPRNETSGTERQC